jgi:hypothetical protein
MSYGLIVYDQNGNVQFNTEDPALYIDNNNLASFSSFSNTSGNTYSTSSGTGNVYREAITSFTSTTDLIIGRPAGGSGFLGYTAAVVGGTETQYFFGNRGYTIGGTSTSASAFAGATLYSAATAADLTAPTSGYGLTIWDGGTPQRVTFTTDPAGTGISFASWLAVVKIVPEGTSYGGGTDPTGDVVYTAPSQAAYDNTYVILNNHTYRQVWEQSTDPDTVTLEGVAQCPYFDDSNNTISIAQYTYDKTTVSGNWTANFPTSGYSQNTANVAQDYYIVQAF